ncbi:MAG TPA: SprT family zinc-dependent metalloprotease [Patescibacteria group bacterium]|nr:SprT family zinc-dependent metalloprotease [Patescibacteria group bacterium]
MPEINLEFKSGKSYRRLAIRVFPSGRVVVTKPRRLSVSQAQFFVDKKMHWIRKKLEFYKSAHVYDWKDYVPDLPKSLEFVKGRLAHFNQHYQFAYGMVRVKNQKSVWGTCSARKNLNFNAKIIALPPEQADYIIVHELCHTRELNHSQKFWDLVAEQIPDYKRIKQELKLYSFD